MRVGFGYDSHRFVEGVPLVLGGIGIPDHPGLAGHSDGDAVAHAVIDALLGAVAAGNVGSHFPPTDERWKGADSMDLLARAIRILEGRNYQVVNLDVTVVCETPRISPWSDQMREALGRVLGVGKEHVSVKGKTNEGMGWIGTGEGLAVFAVAAVDSMGRVGGTPAS
ncbi:MAG TPA: 2-C-methyl-D-erythritol 2,4-cyclodiphosphate synthase [Longimicrobiales bacterium]|jgi:2-C-methyl-D-erythritol 2,4-cyclodiphosphate synthase